jgi:formate hydrogenlyase transcriptional activator
MSGNVAPPVRVLEVNEKRPPENAMRERFQEWRAEMDANANNANLDVQRAYNGIADDVFSDIVGDSAALRAVLKQVERVAKTDCTVLILGETGSGKELFAQAVHRASLRSAHPFVKFNCAAIPTGLLESELFGHERGAFTGAVSKREGRFELAKDGTIFLDEIGEVPLDVQPKLLRVLQEREFERLGSSRPIRSNARLVAATNRNLAEMCDAREFREDLYYRLNVFPIQIPPLRERRDDIPRLVQHYVRVFAARARKEVRTVSRDVMSRLASYDWPGNVRELQNVIERSVILAEGPCLEAAAMMPARGLPPSRPAGVTLEDVNRSHILAVLESTNGVIAGPNGAAARLGINRTTLNFRMKKLGISQPRLSRRNVFLRLASG